MTAPARPGRAGTVTFRDSRRCGRTTPTTRPARAALYVRVSTEEQAREGVSLDAQEVRLRAYAAAQGFAEVELYRDEGVSASKPLGDRPQGAAMLAAIVAGGAIGEGALGVPVPEEQAVLGRAAGGRPDQHGGFAGRLSRDCVPTKRGASWYAGTVSST